MDGQPARQPADRGTMHTYAELNLYRAMPLSIAELLRVVDRITPQESAIINRLNMRRLQQIASEKAQVNGEAKLFSIDEDVSEEVTGQISVPSQELYKAAKAGERHDDMQTQQDISPHITEGSFFESTRKKEMPVESIIDAFDSSEGSITELVHKAVQTHADKLSSVQLTYEYELCEANEQQHYYMIRLATRFDPERKDKEEDMIASVQQVPYLLNTTCENLEHERLAHAAEHILYELTMDGNKRDIMLKTVLPGITSDRKVRSRIEELREKYCRR